MFNKKISHC